MTYLDKLIEEKNYVGAAALCKSILTDAKAWQDQVYRFLHLGQLHVSNTSLHLPSSIRLMF